MDAALRRDHAQSKTLLLGVARRLAARLTIAIMLAAFAAVGPNEGSVLVLIGCSSSLLLGTGPLSLWSPEAPRRAGARTSAPGCTGW